MSVRILIGDARQVLARLPERSVHCAVSSPPYFGLRSYLPDGHPDKALEIGLEQTPAEYVAALVSVFREVRRVLRDDATLWLVLGDSYAGSWGAQGHRETPATLSRNQIGNHPKRASHTGTIRQAGLKPKDLIGIPWMCAFALRDDGWFLRKEIIWAKRAPMPESVRDRPTSAHEHVFLLSKRPTYFYDADAVAESATSNLPVVDKSARSRNRFVVTAAGKGGKDAYGSIGYVAPGKRNMRDVWLLGPEPYSGAHFAVFPSEIPRRAIKAGTSEHGCCPACGAPWVRVIAAERRPNWIGGDGQKHDGTHYRQNPGGGVSNDKRSRREIGWSPTCTCADGDPIPCTVLDPFLGAGTTGLVADELRRDCVGIELNPDSAALAENRIRDASLLFASVDVVPPVTSRHPKVLACEPASQRAQ